MNDRPILSVIEGEGKRTTPPRAWIRREPDGVVVRFISEPAEVDRIIAVLDGRKKRWVRDVDEA